MPRSKRNREVHLTKVKKAPSREKKDELIEKIQDACEQFDFCFLLGVKNQRNDFIKDIRTFFGNHGRLFMGKNNMMKLALGTSPESELENGISDLSLRISGEVAVLFVQKATVSEHTKDAEKDFSTIENVRTILETNPLFNRLTTMKSGEIAPRTIVLPKGPLTMFEGATMETHLRTLGMPTKLDDRVITLLRDHEVCKEGERVNVDQAQILKLLHKNESEFRLEPICYWDKETGRVIVLDNDTAEEKAEKSKTKIAKKESKMQVDTEMKDESDSPTKAADCDGKDEDLDG